jgi:hypothetical protein
MCWNSRNGITTWMDRWESSSRVMTL